MPVRLRKSAPRQVAVAVAQPGLVSNQRLLDAVDEHGLRRARTLERVAGPDDDVAAAPGQQAAHLAAQPDRLGRPRGDHRQRLAPADASRPRYVAQGDEIAGILAL